jgi:hypothetical protein
LSSATKKRTERSTPVSERYTREEFERDLKARREKEAREEEERKEKSEKESARRAWLRDGGNARDFERQWPQLRDEARRRRIMDADQRARASQRAQGISKI